jgi:branched-subunit amino acid aminotransferase/4-amino-4-deoxychorismate lyase
MELDGRPVTTTELGALGLYNYGHFTTMRVENARVRGLALHLDRLAGDCQTLYGVSLDLGRVRDLVKRAVDPRPTVVRVTVFDPDLDLGRPGEDARAHVLVTTRPAGPVERPPLRLGSASYERELPEVKHVGLFGALYQRRAAQSRGFDDVVFVDRASRVSECATANIAFLDGNRVVWPQAVCLVGVTMRLLQEIMDKAGFDVTAAPVPLGQVPDMRAAFVTNAAFGLRLVESIDGIAMAAGSSLIDRLKERYWALPGETL